MGAYRRATLRAGSVLCLSALDLGVLGSCGSISTRSRIAGLQCQRATAACGTDTRDRIPGSLDCRLVDYGGGTATGDGAPPTGPVSRLWSGPLSDGGPGVRKQIHLLVHGWVYAGDCHATLEFTPADSPVDGTLGRHFTATTGSGFHVGDCLSEHVDQ